jgi:hypothetical protein
MLSRVLLEVVAEMIIRAARKSQQNTTSHGAKIIRTISSRPDKVTRPESLLSLPVVSSSFSSSYAISNYHTAAVLRAAAFPLIPPNISPM